MKIKSITVENFGSFKHLEFDFEENGLSLISGSTGSGKSTFCDMLPWILFGKTAKKGAVDDVRAWGVNESTIGQVFLEIHGIPIIIRRIRGEACDNNLTASVGGSTIVGKDLTDTQRRINQILGITLDTYLSGAYLHEFSQTAGFFTATAKNRRQITEQLVDLSGVIKLTKALTERIKTLKTDLLEVSSMHKSALLKVENINDFIDKDKVQIKIWNEKHVCEIERVKQKAATFLQDKNSEVEKLWQDYHLRENELKEELKELILSLTDKDYQKEIQAARALIESLSKETCTSCGAPVRNEDKLIAVKHLHTLETEEKYNDRLSADIWNKNKALTRWQSDDSPPIQAIVRQMNMENVFEIQLKGLESKINPFEISCADKLEARKQANKDVETFATLMTETITALADAELLESVCEALRITMVSSMITRIETTTNHLLSEYFDAEISVKFDVEDADKLEVLVFKDGNSCSYAQLSKGQRQILKLCFGASIMRAVNNLHSFNVVFFDEALDGLDDTLKLKAYGLLEKISQDYDSMFVVEHNEGLKTMFTNRYEARLVNGSTQFEKV